MRKVALSAEAVAIPSVAEICRKLTELLEEAVGAEKPSLVLLSGGLDTSIIALLARRKVERLTALASTYLALQVASSFASEVYTGDGADELFLGYSSLTNFALNFEALDIFTALDTDFPQVLGKEVGIKVYSPFLSPKVIRFGKTIPPQYKIRRERDKLYGKWILRKAFEGYLPQDIVWREKVPFDRGCGVLRCAQGFFQSTTP